MPSPSPRQYSGAVSPDAQETILCSDTNHACETYVFEPTQEESPLGFLFAAGITKTQQGLGSELLDTVVSAIQREYYRDYSRSAPAAFEMALHQANLILHDMGEQGVREWMTDFHVALGVLAKSQLHVSVAGHASISLVRTSHMAVVSEGLAQSPITTPLQTFSQIASGEVLPRDTVFLSSAPLESIFRTQDIERFTLDHSAVTIAKRMEQLYADQRQHIPIGFVTVSLLPQYVTPKRNRPNPNDLAPAVRSPRASLPPSDIRPRRPLDVRRSVAKTIISGVVIGIQHAWRITRTKLFPALRTSTRLGRAAITQASRATSRGIQVATSQSSTTAKKRFSGFSPKSILAGMLDWFLSAPYRIRKAFVGLPLSSKIFAVLSLVLVIALISSLLLLQHKRAADAEIERASELLHEAQTKQEAADTALIYDNRDQAHALINEVKDLTSKLLATGLYSEETATLQQELRSQEDRLQRITRAGATTVRPVGDFREVASGAPPTDLFFINDALYSYNPDTNAVLLMTLEGNVEEATKESQGIGFLTRGAASRADKTVLFLTNPTGMALFDAKDKTLREQEVSLATAKPDIGALNIFGNRVYLYDNVSKNIFQYNKTLRGFAGGTPWLNNSDQAGSITSFSIDGSIYALTSSGAIQKFYKGDLAAFEQEPVEPNISTATKLYTEENFRYIYILDPEHNRVVVYTKNGALVRQIYIEVAALTTDMAISPDETKLYILNGTQVLEVDITEAPTVVSENP